MNWTKLRIRLFHFLGRSKCFTCCLLVRLLGRRIVLFIARVKCQSDIKLLIRVTLTRERRDSKIPFRLIVWQLQEPSYLDDPARDFQILARLFVT